jgi:hypothetical protein
MRAKLICRLILWAWFAAVGFWMLYEFADAMTKTGAGALIR